MSLPSRYHFGEAAVILLAVLYLTLASHSPAAGQSTQANPPLARLEIDVWPEFDRESAVLVILRAEIAPEVALPAPVSVRIPAASGGPSAVAAAASADSQLLNLTYERSDIQVDFMTISFTVTERLFHVEFYDPLVTITPQRDYRYMWSGDFAAAQATVQFQEPAMSSSVTLTPDLGASSLRSDGLSYREADIGALEAGKSLVIQAQYTKPDLRTSADIMGFTQPSPSPSSGDSKWESTSLLILLGVGAAAIVTAGGALLAWRRLGTPETVPMSRVQRRRAAASGRGSVCDKCSTAVRASDRFCPSCGHPIKTG